MPSIVSPLPPDPSTCGYCSPPGQRSKVRTNHHAACLMPVRLTCEVYRKMIDRGWRRSGEYCYKPDLKRACCPQYTIRLDALEFKPTKSQRKLVNRFNRWILHGEDHEDKKKKGKANETFVLEETLHYAEHRICLEKNIEAKHKFEVTLEPSSYTYEKFTLFQKYQQDTHKEKEKMPSSFKRFLVDTPLPEESISYTSDTSIPEHLPHTYGSYHQLYRIDGELIAMAVLDILPNCVSSVYFMYDSKWERFSLGKLSALREVSLAKEIHKAGAKTMGWLYMGFYIYSCPKMRYKGEYSPSYLADPEDYSWHPLEECVPLLEKNRYACFAHPEHSIEGDYVGPPLSPDPSPSLLEKAQYLINMSRGRQPVLAPVTMMPEYLTSSSARLTLGATIEALGEEILEDTWFYTMYEM
ncbi:arginine-tRNA-protein transferase [Irpex rosettiformis]|uniref:Arginine-tRNA-protein transferase n=1 Tax=Irpex rosettiformis TaxID=378272 RepID=A0ACB8UCA4_9APHY|nr:arginine-tRNA-protein transferase [Irpex rosettiformis]